MKNTFKKLPSRQRGMVMFIALILLLVLTLLGVALARMQTVEERLAQNDANHAMALQTAEAALQAAFDNDAAGVYTDWSGATPGVYSVSAELGGGTSTAGYQTTWTPGVNSIAYAGSGPALASAPAAATPAYVLEALAPAAPQGCSIGGGGTGYPPVVIFVHRITAHSQGGDGSASATVQTVHIGGC
ncbi:MAG TPA: PilX N-terminal domain-containing pilus assembly protein [Steroidobacteraceae bacterium]|jgi:type IV pilus assembly protein PilX|nr:PilX N-terminal domain-containing pilus assembly protein [Steroidobacteraceae bacterium]